MIYETISLLNKVIFKIMCGTRSCIGDVVCFFVSEGITWLNLVKHIRFWIVFRRTH